MRDALARLQRILERYGQLAIAVSGGVDSITLARVAAEVTDIEVIHAVSPAVPAAATQRVRDHARRHGWRLIITNAGEFADPEYLRNPVNRCYFCKSNLYGRIATLTDRTIASGTNLDDLSDYRPGLTAAAERAVIHPFVEAEIDKPTLRAIAVLLGLHDVADLPAQPCLSSRVETGIAIMASDLLFIDQVERAVRQASPEILEVRCRLTAQGIVLELDAQSSRLGRAVEVTRRLTHESGRSFVGFRPYRRGASFIRPGETNVP